MEIYDVKKMTERLNSKVLKERYIAKDRQQPGVYKIEYSPPGGGGGIKSKGLELEKKIKAWKRRKNQILEDFTVLAVTKDSI